MNVILIVITLLFSAIAQADLSDNAFAKLEYQEIAIHDLHTVAAKIKYVPSSPSNVAYYQGYVIVTATVEGNICTSVPSSFGTIRTLEGKTVYTKLIAGHVWTNQLSGCLQYSNPTKVTFPVSVSWLVDNGSGVNQSIANFKIGQYALKPASIVLNAKGNNIQVSIRK